MPGGPARPLQEELVQRLQAQMRQRGRAHRLPDVNQARLQARLRHLSHGSRPHVSQRRLRASQEAPARSGLLHHLLHLLHPLPALGRARGAGRCLRRRVLAAAALQHLLRLRGAFIPVQLRKHKLQHSPAHFCARPQHQQGHPPEYHALPSGHRGLRGHGRGPRQHPRHARVHLRPVLRRLCVAPRPCLAPRAEALKALHRWNLGWLVGALKPCRLLARGQVDLQQLVLYSGLPKQQAQPLAVRAERGQGPRRGACVEQLLPVGHAGRARSNARHAGGRQSLRLRRRPEYRVDRDGLNGHSPPCCNHVRVGQNFPFALILVVDASAALLGYETFTLQLQRSCSGALPL